jgi:sulfur carrier protein
MLDIRINGQTRNFSMPLSVAELLQELQLQPEQVVVELNHQILVAEQYAKTQLNNDDNIELIQFVGGG